MWPMSNTSDGVSCSTYGVRRPTMTAEAIR
jgi:hypothetical protein